MADTYNELYSNLYIASQAKDITTIANKPVIKDDNINSDEAVVINLGSNDYANGQTLFELNKSLPYGDYIIVIRAKREQASESEDAVFQVETPSSQGANKILIKKKDFKEDYSSIVISFSTNNITKDATLSIQKYDGLEITAEGERGIRLASSKNVYAKNQHDERKACKQNDLFNLGGNK